MYERYCRKQSTFIVLLEFIEKIKRGKNMAQKKKYGSVAYLGGLLLVIFYLVPYFVLGKQASFRITDFLDDEVIQYMLSGKYFFTGFNTKVAEWFNGADKFAIQAPCFLLIWPFYFFTFYNAIMVSVILGEFFAYTGMFLLLQKIFKGEYPAVTMVISFLFSILPFYPSYGLSSIGIPLVIWAFWKVSENKCNVLAYMTICFWGLYSSLVWSGYFIIGFVLIFVFFLFLKKRKKCGLRVLWGSLILTATYVFSFKDTIYGIFFSGVESHRNTPGREYIPARFKDTFVSLFKYGQYHAPSYHTYIMAGSLLLIILVLFLLYVSPRSRIVKNKWFLAVALWTGAVIIAVFSAFYQSEAGYWLRGHLGVLQSVQLDRVYWLYPTIWYTEAAVCMAIFYDLCKVYIRKPIACKALYCIEIVGVLVFMVPYLIGKNTEYKSNLFRVMGKDNGLVSYKEYYDEKLFTEIKDYIHLEPAQYRVVCLGLTPAVASANGLYTLDAYSTNYSLDYKMKFRKVIAAELDKNADLEWYFDSWGNRCYLFSAELGKNWDVNKKEPAYISDWGIDTQALKELTSQTNVKTYILSAVEIRNASDIGLDCIQEFDQPDSYRHIYLYNIL